MRLLGFEFKKIVQNHSFLVLTVLLLISSIFLVALFESNTNDQYVKHYEFIQRIREAYLEYDLEERVLKLKEEQLTLQTYYDIENLLRVISNNPTMVMPYSQPEIEDYEKHAATYSSDLASEIQAFEMYIKYISDLLNYPNYIQKVIDDSHLFAKQPAFKQYPMWQQESILSTPGAYSHLVDIPLAEVNFLSLQRLEDNPARYVVIIAFVLLLTSTVFLKDDEAEMTSLLLVIQKGRMRTYLNKMVVMLVLLLVFVASITVINLGYLQLRYGILEFSTLFQSILYFYESPYVFTVLEYSVCSVVFMTLSVWLLSIFCYLLIVVTRRIRIGITLFILVIGLSGVLYHLINESSILVPLKYLNLYSLLQFGSIVRHYKLFHFMGVTLSRLGWSCLFVVSAVTLFLSLGWIIFRRQFILQWKYQFIPNYWREQWFGRTSIFFHETHKLLWMNKGIIVITAVLLIHSYLLYPTISAQKTSTELATQAYYEHLRSYTSEEQAQHFSQKMHAITALEQEYQEILQKSELTDEDRASITAYYQGYEERQRFKVIEREYTNSGQQLVYARGFRSLFSEGSFDRELMSSLLILIVIVSAVSVVYAEDQQQGQNELYELTLHGRGPRRKMKILLVVSIVFGLALIVYLTEYLALHRLYPMVDFQSTIKSVITINQDRNFPVFIRYPDLLNVRIWVYLVALYGLRLIAVFAATFITILISKISTSKMTSLIAAMIFFVFPMFLYIIGFDGILNVSLFDVLSGNLFIKYSYNLLKLAAYVLMAAAGYVYVRHKTSD